MKNCIINVTLSKLLGRVFPHCGVKLVLGQMFGRSCLVKLKSGIKRREEFGRVSYLCASRLIPELGMQESGPKHYMKVFENRTKS